MRNFADVPCIMPIEYKLDMPLVKDESVKSDGPTENNQILISNNLDDDEYERNEVKREEDR